ncbi:MAG: hypothetical protein JWM36_394 [Hyphomicrobiales bacterium]|nr:hypothetical protein [Hyphomicrobiales bacterium]
MRRPIKPFAVELRRPARKAGTSTETDEKPQSSTVWPGADSSSRKLRDDDDDGYFAAMRAADAVFGKADQPKAATTKTEGSWTDQLKSDVPVRAPRESAATSAAEQLFKKPTPPVEEQPGSDTDAHAARRILPSLTEEDPVHLILADEAAQPRKRRGRPAKIRVEGETPPPRPRGRPRKVVAEIPNVPVQAHAPVVLHEPAPAARPVAAPQSRKLPGYVRGDIYSRWARHDTLRPGERWKKRLPKICW